ncbi:MAG: Transcriptional regulatory protein LiaR [Candidatus Ordinivivax streblomastigis]|uniref:Transcriptional regulatory protein LiaR n=1 Tax=Candidatus Ordinivivax streblomastigis TaxID=2540710 RepID=A0A5M8P2H3_9BACT|nr:MAG: Transcriptional regulatory protein LiaR [Candidatus Ordinivivax streblomastigis]
MKYKSVILADNQDITAAGMRYFLRKNSSKIVFPEVKNKRELIDQLLISSATLVVLDYSLFDFTRVEELIILQNRFVDAHFLLFSDELTDEFVKQVSFSQHPFSILLKDCSGEEIKQAIGAIQKGKSFVCQRIANHLQTRNQTKEPSGKKLTGTELEVLKLIASGKSTREIALERCLSMHTIMTHRKNIFRKLDVNNLHEATRYALRTGILDASDYYI